VQKSTPRFFDLARLKQQIDADNAIPLDELHKRDSEIGGLISEQGAMARLLCWLGHLDPESSENHHPEGFIIFWLLVLGFLSGVLAMSGVLFASKQQPVNILLFLALFVGVQLLLVVISAVAAFFPFDRGRLTSPLAYLNPAVLLLKRSLKKLSSTMPWESIPQLTRIAVMRWGQVLGVAFNLALLATLLVVLAISDRSFGWSSTLNVSESALLGLLETISLPWSWFADNARVSAEMVANTRFQSLQNTFDSSEVEAMRHWWPFLFASIAFYGLLPRLFLLIIFRALLKRGVQRTFLQYPGTALVLSRLDSPVVTTHDRPEEHRMANAADITIQTSLPTGQGFTVVNWAGALDSDDYRLDQLGIKVSSVVNAGLDLRLDKQVIGSHGQHSESLIVAVKSWEPPLAELKDFLVEISNGGQVYLLLLPLKQRLISAHELSDWQHFVSQILQLPVQLLRGDLAKHGKGLKQ